MASEVKDGRDLQIVFLNETEPITQQIADAIEANISDRIINDGASSRFESFEKNNDHILVTCSDQVSLQWLLGIGSATVSLLQYGCPAGCFSFNITTSNCLKNMTVCTINYPKRLSTFKSSSLLHQNKNLDGKNWIRLATKPCDDRTMMMLYRIDSASVQWLRDHNWEVYYGLTKLKVTRFDDRLYNSPKSTDIPAEELKYIFTKHELRNVPGMSYYNRDLNKHAHVKECEDINSAD